MLYHILISIALPTVLATALLAVLLFYLGVYKYKELPEAIAPGFTRSKYLLTIGLEKGTTDVYYDLDTSITDPLLIGPIVEWYSGCITQIARDLSPINRLAFIEKDSGPVGAILLAGELVSRSKIPGIIVRLRRRLSVNSVKGYEVANALRAVVISDVITSGGSLKKTIAKLVMSGIHVTSAIFLISRMNSEEVRALECDLGITILYAYVVKESKDLEKSPMREMLDAIKNRKGSQSASLVTHC